MCSARAPLAGRRWWSRTSARQRSLGFLSLRVGTMEQAMQLDIIDSFAAFEALEANWKAVYAADPEAHYFLSWGWMRQLFSDEGNNWVSWPRGIPPTIAIMSPFSLLLRRVRFSKSRQRFCSEIQMAGEHLLGRLHRFHLSPRPRNGGRGFGAHLRSMGWRRLTLKNFRAPAKRLASFISALEGPDLHHDERQRIEDRQYQSSGLSLCLLARGFRSLSAGQDQRQHAAEDPPLSAQDRSV